MVSRRDKGRFSRLSREERAVLPPGMTQEVRLVVTTRQLAREQADTG
jgi:hypothetical protein